MQLHYLPVTSRVQLKLRHLKEYQSTPLFSFYIRLLRNTAYIVFQWQLFYLWTDFYAGLRDFCPVYYGSKNVKFSGVGVPL